MGYLQTSPVRKLLHDPQKIILPFIEQGMKILEIGPGMGWFSLPIAHAVGPEGKLYAIDIQQRMLDGLHCRAERTGVASRIECRLSDEVSLPIDDLKETVSLTFAFAAVHEILYKDRLFQQIHTAMIPAGTMIMMDPERHCSRNDFEESIATAEACGFTARPGPELARYHSVVLVRLC
jgi:ubiquinone/menaquinone biosynthesis C-methylase UbiE